jgi:hypothetical protein
MKRTNKKSARLSKSLKKHARRLAAYSAAAAATVVATGNTANAGEVVYDTGDLSTNQSLASVFFNMANGAASVVYPAAQAMFMSEPGVMRLEGYYFSSYTTPTTSGATGYYFPSPYIYVAHLYVTTQTSQSVAIGGTTTSVGAFKASTSAGYPYAIANNGNAAIAPADSWNAAASSGFEHYGYYANLYNWNDGQKKFAGIRFVLPTGVDDALETYYGWAEITVAADYATSKAVTLHGFGYNDVAGTASVTPATSTQDVTGDYNFGGDVEQADLDLVLQAWGDAAPDPLGPPYRDPTWLSQNPIDAPYANFVDQNDLDAVLQNWGNNTPPPLAAATAAVPEPSSVLLLAAGAAGLASWRRRRTVA